MPVKASYINNRKRFLKKVNTCFYELAKKT